MAMAMGKAEAMAKAVVEGRAGRARPGGASAVPM